MKINYHIIHIEKNFELFECLNLLRRRAGDIMQIYALPQSLSKKAT